MAGAVLAGSRRLLALAAVLVVSAALGTPAAGAQAPAVCLGDLTADGVERRPGPALRFGINPAGEAGALGPAVPFVADDPPRTLQALAELRRPGAPFVVRLNRFFWADGEAGIRRFLALARRYTDAGYLVELQVRYHPGPGQEGDVAGFVAFVREIVRRFGPNLGVVAMQVTNEVNFTVSPDSSDGAYAGARDALVRGVIAAKDEARRRGHDHLTVGFNWFFRTDPSNEASFWAHLRDQGGAPFRAAVDWVGLDAYPGTFFPPAEAPGGERDGMVAAMSQLRRCFMPIAGLGAGVPIHVEENGWPTGPGRSEGQQVAAMRAMVGAVHDFRGTYNVTDYRWFDLRDHNTASGNFQHHYGLLRDDYGRKPAFAAFRELVGALARPDPAAAVRARRPRLALGLHHRRPALRRGGTCAAGPVRAAVVGLDAGALARVDFRVGSRRVGVRTRRPFGRLLPLARPNRLALHRITALARLRDGRRLVLRRVLRTCPR